MAQAKTAVVDASSVQIRFEPMGPDVYGQNQPQELLAAIAEDVEPLKDLVDQHVVSIQPFRPEVLLRCFAWRRNLRAIQIAIAVTTRRSPARF